MSFKTTRVINDVEVYQLRELSAGAVECVDDSQSEYTQALTMLALSLCDDELRPLYPPEDIAIGLAFVRDLPATLVRDKLIPAATALNTDDMEDARGN